MKKIANAFASLVVITALGTPVLAAQEPAPRPMPQEDARQAQPAPDEAATAKGQLVNVDADQMTLVIKDDTNQEHTFRFTDATKVVGATVPIAQLSAKAGSTVEVRFVQGGGDARIATEVRIDAA